MNWNCKKFTELTPNELYHILQLRNEVFVVEQDCVFQDADDKDEASYHLFCYTDDVLAAYARLLPAGLSFKEVSIGRIVTKPSMRSTGLGKKLVIESIEQCEKLFGKQMIRIGAQYHLTGFYNSFGFKEDGAIYDEDGIDHIEMVRK